MDARKVEIKDRASAGKKLGRDDASRIAERASRLIIAKGKSVHVFEPAGKPDDETVAAMLGATGNLRAPTIVVGKTVIVGFSEDEYEKALG